MSDRLRASARLEQLLRSLGSCLNLHTVAHFLMCGGGVVLGCLEAGWLERKAADLVSWVYCCLALVAGLVKKPQLLNML